VHDTARQTGEAFFRSYVTDNAAVLDVGSMDVNGTLRPFALGETYIGCDVERGPGVDIVLIDPYTLPFDADRFDVVVSTSCLEHDEFFWLTFAEMARVVRPGGFIYINAPTGGNVHRHPVDCWRFYPDAGRALARWAVRSGHNVSLVESFVRPAGLEGWVDFVAVFGKRHGGILTRPPKFLADNFPDAIHRVP
jgi:SAM-dependent methyltransferase